MKNISTRTSKNKNLPNAVIEIDEVEYLIDGKAVEEIEIGKANILLKRLIDSDKRSFSIETIQKSIKDNGIIDHLN